MISRFQTGAGPKTEANWLHSHLRHLIGDHPPVPTRTVVEHFGLTLDAFAFRTEISGILIRDGDRYHIAVNRRHPESRQRFSAAHELYHYLRHRWRLAEGGIWICEDDPPEWLRETELEANTFAAELLAPGLWVWDVWARHGNIPACAAELGISVQAMRKRLAELHLLRRPGRSCHEMPRERA